MKPISTHLVSALLGCLIGVLVVVLQTAPVPPADGADEDLAREFASAMHWMRQLEHLESGQHAAAGRQAGVEFQAAIERARRHVERGATLSYQGGDLRRLIPVVTDLAASSDLPAGVVRDFRAVVSRARRDVG